MTKIEKRDKKIKAIGEIYNAGFEIKNRDSNTIEPILIGGYEYVARRGSYLLVYNISDRNICLQKTKLDYIEWDKEFIIKWLSFDNFEDDSLSLTISMKIGLDYYRAL